MRTQGEPDWRDNAACSTTDPDVFFVAPADRAGTRRAQAICDGCASKAACGKYAIEREEVYGVWGGLSEMQRKAMRSRAQRLSA